MAFQSRHQWFLSFLPPPTLMTLYCIYLCLICNEHILLWTEHAFSPPLCWGGYTGESAFSHTHTQEHIIPLALQLPQDTHILERHWVMKSTYSRRWPGHGTQKVSVALFPQHQQRSCLSEQDASRKRYIKVKRGFERAEQHRPVTLWRTRCSWLTWSNTNTFNTLTDYPRV